MLEYNIRRQPEESGFMRYAEPAMTMLSGAVAEPISGLVGLTALPFGADVASSVIDRTQQALTYQPRTELGQTGLQDFTELLAPVSEAFEGASSYLGDTAYEATGSPGLAAAAYSMPTAAMELLGLKGARLAGDAGMLGKQYEVSGIGDTGLSQGQRGAVSGVGIPGQPEGRVMQTASEKLTFVDGEDGRIHMYNPNREEWMDVTDSLAGINARNMEQKIIDAGGRDAWLEQKKQDELRFEERYKQREAEREARRLEEEESYKVQHQAPMLDDNPSGVDLNDVFPDIYTHQGLTYYGTGASYDQKAINIIQGMQGKPNKQVTIYRAVPESVTEINPSDWVTTTKEYAADHMAGEKGWHILSKKVKAKDIANDGNSIHEFGYDPQ
jgi:hypothetical protein